MQLRTFATTYRAPISLLVVAVGAWFLIWYFWLPPNPISAQSVSLVVTQGQGSREIAQSLADAGLIRSNTLFVLYVRVAGLQSSLKAGTYILSPSMSVPEIARIIAGGKGLSDDVEVTIHEGVNIWEIDRIVASSTLSVTAGQFSTRYRSQEGELFPETYRFAKDATVADVAQKMADEFRIRATGYTSSQIIIASILEKEAKTADDMAMVSGIIAQRMALKMPLQVDATVGYGWCVRTVKPGAFCDVTQAPIATEIKIDGPYNTYTRTGLPVGPIANPGLQALNAAAHPKDSPYLYYLSTRDGSQLIYAKTLDEHLKNRLKYLGF